MSPWFPSLIVIVLFLALKLEISWITPWSVRIRRWETCVYFDDRKRNWNEFLMKRFIKKLWQEIATTETMRTSSCSAWANTSIYRYFSVFKRRKERYLLKTCFYTRSSKPVSVKRKICSYFSFENCPTQSPESKLTEMRKQFSVPFALRICLLSCTKSEICRYFRSFRKSIMVFLIA